MMSSKVFLPVFYFAILFAEPFSFSQSNIGESASAFLTSMPPGATVLSGPEDQSSELPIDLKLSWFSQIHSSSFSLKVSSLPDLSNPVIDQSDITDTIYTVSGLSNNTTYYWQVTARNVAGNGDPSPIWGFTTIVALPGSVSLDEPANGSADVSVEMELKWYSIQDADKYHLLLSKSPDLSNPVIDQPGITDTTYAVSGLSNNTPYYWQVAAANVAGDGDPSSIWTFTTIVALPDAPSLAEPPNEKMDLPVEITLKWNAVPDADTYHMLLSESPDLSNPIIDLTGLTDTVYVVSGLEHSTTYFWQVTAANVAGDGDPSSPWSFTTVSATSIGKQMDAPGKDYALKVYPNPSDATVRIEYQLPEELPILITVYNSQGQAIQLLDAGVKRAGRYVLEWNGTDQSGERVKAGAYFCRLKAGKTIVTRKIILINYK